MDIKYHLIVKAVSISMTTNWFEHQQTRSLKVNQKYHLFKFPALIFLIYTISIQNQVISPTNLKVYELMKARSSLEFNTELEMVLGSLSVSSHKLTYQLG